MKNQIAQKREFAAMTSGEMKDVIAAVVQGIPVYLPRGSKKRLLNELKEVYASIIANPYADMVLEWEQFYLKYFDARYDFSTILIPDCPGENWRLLIIVDFLLDRLYVKCKERFNCRWWTNNFGLDEIVVENERNTKNNAYAIWVKDEIGVDSDLKNISAIDIKAKGITTETLAERLIHELKFFDEKEKHLDIKSVTLCSGSRYRDGGVPCVVCVYDEVRILWYPPEGIQGHMGSRQVVS